MAQRSVLRVFGTEAKANAIALRALLNANPMAPSVTLDVTAAPKSSVLEHVATLYNEAAAFDIATQLSILLRAHGAKYVTERPADVDLQPIVAAHLAEELGYDLDEYVAMGGTFDRLHAGHKVLLTYSILHARTRLRIGVTGEALLVKKKNKELLQPFDVRQSTVEHFVRSIRQDLEYEVVELTEPSGGTNEIAGVTGMVVSPETLPAVASINEERAKRGLQPMRPITIEYVGPQGNRVSSTQLREAELKRKEQHSN
jgi:phosphopantetheine adenylyltransferase